MTKNFAYAQKFRFKLNQSDSSLSPHYDACEYLLCLIREFTLFSGTHSVSVSFGQLPRVGPKTEVLNVLGHWSCHKRVSVATNVVMVYL